MKLQWSFFFDNTRDVNTAQTRNEGQNIRTMVIIFPRIKAGWATSTINLIQSSVGQLRGDNTRSSLSLLK